MLRGRWRLFWYEWGLHIFQILCFLALLTLLLWLWGKQ